MKVAKNEPLASLTSFGVGGPAEKLITIESSEEVAPALAQESGRRLWRLGYGTNVLISDQGLPDTTLLFRNQKIEEAEGLIVADAGVWWDDLVEYAIARNLWGLELMSGIPGSVGAGVFINITAYGQSLAERLAWVETLDYKTRQLNRLNTVDFAWGYKQTVFQSSHREHLIVRAAFDLKPAATTELTYQSALDVAEAIQADTTTLNGRRQIIMEARERAGSLFSFKPGDAKTVGSFFRNPKVTREQAKTVMRFDETGKSQAQIAKMNAVHGGDSLRVSAAHVLLAAGFERGQSWGPVRLHPKNLLKIENTGGASATQIYDVAKHIIDTVRDKLNIELQAEAQLLGEF